MKKIFNTILLFLFFALSLNANIIHVPADTASIQGGIDMAVNGDTVLVQPGTYVENINFNGKNIVVGSLTLFTGDTSYISQTVIDGNQSGRVVTIESGENSTAILTGFTITNGTGGLFLSNSNPSMSYLFINNNISGPPGGGILCQNSGFSLSDATISNNSGNDGGGIGASNSTFNLSNVNILNNSAHSDDGGGIGCESCDFNLSNVLIANNIAADKGGGIELLNGGNIILDNLTIANNSAGSGGGIWFDGDSCNLSNVIIHDNYSIENGGGIYFTENVVHFNFNSDNRSSIYLNQTSQLGNDLYSANLSIIPVIVDTFTVLVPDNSHAYPLHKFTFDIQNEIGTSANIGTIINIPGDVSTIQGGINLATDGDTVLVQPGTYVENINFNGKNIVVGSLTLTTGDTSYISQTVIDGSQPSNPFNGSVVYFISGENSTAMLNGFKITRGSGTRIGSGPSSQTHGGGIFLDNSSCPNLVNLIVTGNVSESVNGAGICCWNNNNCRITNVTVTKNDGSGNANTNDASGGILLANSSPILNNVKITDNIGLISGGLFCNGNSNPVLFNVTIAANTALGSAWTNEIGGLVSWQNSNPILINSILWNNSPKEIVVRDNSLTIAYSDIQKGLDSIDTYNNAIVNWLDGNIDAYPMFVDSVNGDYSLQAGSPCIDAGVQDTFLLVSGLNDIYIPPRSYFGAAPDMGAYEFGPPWE